MLARLSALNERRWLLLLALTAIIIRLPWAAAMTNRSPYGDEVAYVSHAENLCTSLRYVDRKGAESNFWPAGWPAFLSIAYCTFGVRAGVGVGLQIIILTLTCLVVSRMGERRFGRQIGRTGALILALYPNYIFYSTLMLTEPLSTLLSPLVPSRF